MRQDDGHEGPDEEITGARSLSFALVVEDCLTPCKEGVGHGAERVAPGCLAEASTGSGARQACLWVALHGAPIGFAQWSAKVTNRRRTPPVSNIVPP